MHAIPIRELSTVQVLMIIKAQAEKALSLQNTLQTISGSWVARHEPQANNIYPPHLFPLTIL